MTIIKAQKETNLYITPVSEEEVIGLITFKVKHQHCNFVISLKAIFEEEKELQ